MVRGPAVSDLVERTSVTRASVLVVGTYPPIPRPAAAASVAEVRRAWAEGLEVTVVSPRLSAAHLTVAIHGMLAGRRLENVRRLTGATRVVLVVEEGYPFSARSAVLERATAEVLARALVRFDQVRVVRVGDLGVSAAAIGRLVAVATEVVDAPGGVADSEVPGYGVVPGVTVLGPPEARPSERPRQLVGAMARRLLGPRAPQVRARLGSLRRHLAEFKG